MGFVALCKDEHIEVESVYVKGLMLENVIQPMCAGSLYLSLHVLLFLVMYL